MERALKQLETATLRQEIQVDIRPALLGDSGVKAFVLPDGRRYVSKGLLDRFDDRLLLAVLAHELGHLLADNHHTHAADAYALAEYPGNVAVEMQADMLGCTLLKRQGIDPQVMARMLTQLTEEVSPSQRPAITTRRNNVQQQLAADRRSNTSELAAACK